MRIALGVEYDGANYHGWQRQKTTTLTVQECVEKALSKLAVHSVSIMCAGRTDAGVHAYEQVVHFETQTNRQAHEWVHGANSYLPSDIRILWMLPVVDGFHARFSAVARYYRYEILNRDVKSALRRDHVTTVFQTLDVARMQQAAQALIGEHDFSSFRAQGCQAKSPIKTMHWINIERSGDKITIDIIANAFLHHMVRNIVGTLLPIGRGEKEIDWLADVLKRKDRKEAGVTAPPNGLFFKGVYYPQYFGLKADRAFKPFCVDIELSSSMECA